MTDAVRHHLLRVLERLSAEAPQLRFGQLVANPSYIARGPENESVWDVEDGELLAAAERHLETLAGREEAARRVTG